MPAPSIPELQRAIQITEQIQQLEAELASILGSSSSGKPTDLTSKRGRPRKAQVDEPAGWENGNGRAAEKAKGKRKKRKMSAEGRAKIAAAQRARWAKQKGVIEPMIIVGPGPATKGEIRKLSEKAKWRRTAVQKAKAVANEKRKLSPEARARIAAAKGEGEGGRVKPPGR